MEHQMGLLSASISTSTTTVDNVITYDGNSWNGTTWTSSTKTTLSYYVSRTFSSSNKPYIASNTLYYIGKASDNTITFTTSGTETGTLYYAWTLDKNSTTSTVVGDAGTYKSLTIPAYSGKSFRRKIWNYSYVEAAKTWKAPHAGTYTMECWGAQGGGNSSTPGGKGAYTTGQLSLSSGASLYVYVGQKGDVNDNAATSNATVSIKSMSWEATTGVYNAIFNNGFTTMAIKGKWVFAGGGSTDIRTVNGNWNNSSSIDSRIMVAAGGGGTNTYNKIDAGGDAGAYTGYSGLISGSDGVAATGGTQVRGGAHGTGSWVTPSTYYTLTYNAYAAKGQTMWYNVCCSGGGGGLYCGGNGAHGNGTTGSGAGGSSYISGQSGCTTTSGYSFTASYMIDGKGIKYTTASSSVANTNIPSHTGYTAGLGHTGDGYARITYDNP